MPKRQQKVLPEAAPSAKKAKRTFEKKSTPKKADKPEDWNEFKKKKKDLKLKRKQARSGFELVLQAKKMGEKLRCKKLGSVERNKLINELHALLKADKNYEKFVLAHDTSRIVQWLLKYGSETVKSQIADDLVPAAASMLQSKYGIHCIKRLLKYGTSKTRQQIVNQFYSSAVKLVSHAVSAPVFEYAYSNFASAQQKHHLVQEFYGDIYRQSKDNSIKHLKDVFEQSPDMKLATLSATKANLLKVINKGLLDSALVQTVLNQFLSECSAEDRGELIGLLVPHIVVISNTKDGARAAMQCIWHGSNKDRKHAMKTIKEHVVALSRHEHGHCTVIALIDAIDDTVLLHKVILGEILKAATELAVDEWGRKVLLWLVAPTDTTIFHPLFAKQLEEGRLKSTSKKDVNVRRKEILGYSIETLLSLIGNEPKFWLKNSSLAFEMVAIFKAGEGDGLKNAIEKVVEVVCDPEWKVGDVLGVEHAGIHLVLKKLAKQSRDFCGCVVRTVSDETLEKWLGINRACFLLVAIFESGSEEVQGEMRSRLKPMKKVLKEQKFKGCEVLCGKLK